MLSSELTGPEMDPLSSLLGSVVAKKGIEAIWQKMFSSGLRQELRAAAQAWAARLPDDCALNVDTLIVGAGEERVQPAESTLRTSLEHGQIPSRGDWLGALLIRWREKREQLGSTAQLFFLQPEGTVVRHLEELAAALWRVCENDPDLFRTTTLARIPPTIHPALVEARLRTIALEHLADADEWLRDDRLFVPRRAAWECITRFLEGEEMWLSIEGQAGTGKTTLLEKLHASLAQSPDCVPLFLDAAWAALPIHNTPIGQVARMLPGRPENIWDLSLSLADALRPSGVTLLVLLDTLDACLLTESGSRMVQWLRKEAPRGGIRVVSGCRPLEAEAALPPQRFKSHLDDFNRAEAEAAVDAYVRRFYSTMPPASQAEAVRVLRTHLASQAFEDICSRPVTLRMLFEAYPDRPPPDAINRAQLFAAYWDRKVAGRGSLRPRRSSGTSREKLAMALALWMAERRTTEMLDGDLSRILLSIEDGRQAWDDLLTESVTARAESGGDHLFRFFHQSFLEYAAARGILHEETARRRELVDGLVAALRKPGGTPWWNLLEELGIQGQAFTTTPSVTDHVLDELLVSPNPLALASAAVIWCHLTEAQQASRNVERLSGESFARGACLRHLHNAPASALGRLLRDFAGPAWAAGQVDARCEALDAWTRTATVACDVVRAELERLEVVPTIKGLAFDTPGRAQYLIKLGALMSAFLGSRDEYASEALDDLYGYLMASNVSTKSRVHLVSAVAGRKTLTDAAVQLLHRWLLKEERVDVRHQVRLRTALAEALADHSPDHIQLGREQRTLREDKLGEPSLRLVSVWRARVEAGVWAVESTLWREFVRADDLSLISTVAEIGLLPLAERNHASLRDLLLSELETNPRLVDVSILGAKRRDFVYRALGCFAESGAAPILERLRVAERSLHWFGPSQVALLGKYSGLLSEGECARLRDVLRVDDARALLFLDQMDGSAAEIPSIAGELVLDLVGRELPWELRDRAVKAVSRLGHALRGNARQQVAEYLCTLVEGEPTKLPRVALKALPAVLVDSGVPEERIESLIRRLADDWIRLPRDDDASWVGTCLVGLLKIRPPAAAIVELLLARSRSLVDRAGFRETRRTGFEMLASLAQLAHVEVDKELGGLLLCWEESAGKVATDALTGSLLVATALARFSLESGWTHARRVARLAEMSDLGRHPRDTIEGALEEVTRRALLDGGLRETILGDIGALPGILQLRVIRSGRANKDRVLLRKVQEQFSQLKPSARIEVNLWARGRVSNPVARQGEEDGE